MAVHWTIDPNNGVGPIEFGMEPADVSAALGLEPEFVSRAGSEVEHSFANGVRVVWRDGRIAHVELVLFYRDLIWSYREVELSGDRGETQERLAAVGASLVDASTEGGYYLRIANSPVVFWVDDIRGDSLDTLIVQAPRSLTYAPPAAPRPDA